MTVYLDGLFALNACINYLMLLGSARLGGGEIRIRRMAAAACLGGIYAALAMVPALGFLQSIPMRMVVLALMLLCAFGYRRRTVRLGLLFVALAFCFGGAVLVCTQVFRTGLMVVGNSIYYPVSFWGLLTLAALVYLVCRLVFGALAEHSARQFETLELELNGVQVRLRALHDTGNTLRDPMTNEQVTVVHWQVLSRLLPQEHLRREAFDAPAELVQSLSACYPDLRFRLIAYHAVGTQHGLLMAVRCTRKLKNGKQGQILVAFSPTAISDGGNFEALMGGTE